MTTPGYRGEHVVNGDEGDPEMEAWLESLPPVDIDSLARDLKQVEAERGLSTSGNRRYVDPNPEDYSGGDDDDEEASSSDDGGD